MISIDVATLANSTSGAFVGLWRLMHSQTLPLSLWFFVAFAMLQNVMTTPSSMFLARVKFTLAYGLFTLAALADLISWAAAR